VTDGLLEVLKREKLIEVKNSQGGLGEGAYTYGITGAGITRAREALERSQYAGPAPVPFEVYNEAMRKQKTSRMTVTARTMRQLLSQLIAFGPGVELGCFHFHVRTSWKWQNERGTCLW